MEASKHGLDGCYTQGLARLTTTVHTPLGSCGLKVPPEVTLCTRPLGS